MQLAAARSQVTVDSSSSSSSRIGLLLLLQLHLAVYVVCRTLPGVALAHTQAAVMASASSRWSHCRKCRYCLTQHRTHMQGSGRCYVSTKNRKFSTRRGQHSSSMCSL